SLDLARYAVALPDLQSCPTRRSSDLTLGAMSKRVTIAEVAELAGVHKGTVSRALNPATADLVNTATLERIRRAVADLGYVPNVVDRKSTRLHSSHVKISYAVVCLKKK